MILLLPPILGLFFILTSFYIWKKSQIFFLFYFVLFAYTFFTQLGYLLYPQELSIVSHYQYYGEEAIIPYWIYIFLSFISIFFIFAIFYEKKYKTIFSIKVKLTREKSGNFLYTTAILFYEIILIFFLTKNYENLSYINQVVLKDNKIWFYLFSLDGIVLLSIFYKLYTEHTKMKKIFYSIIFLISLSIFLITAIRSGQRIEIAATLLGFLVFIWFTFKDRVGIKNKRQKLKWIFIVCLIGIILFQGIRIIRGHNESFLAFLTAIKNPQTYLSLFLPKNLIFQDWLSPSLTLVTSMERDIIFPGEVIKSNLTVLIPFISHESFGGILSRIIDPEGIQGHGYYILTEGYNFMGFFGFLYSAFIFVIGLRLLESFFASTNDKLFNAFMYGIIAFLSIEIIRGQSIMFLKGVYLYFLPALLLFILMSNKKVYLTGPKMKTEINQK